MILARKISAKLFAQAAYLLLTATGWKKRTVIANAEHAQLDTCRRPNYRQIIYNLVHHASEMLFCFDAYKTLPENCAAYPCKNYGYDFDIAEGSAPVIEKMRKGGIFLTAHYGNYEASGAWLCALGVPLKASFIPLKPNWLNSFVYEKVRCVKGRPYSIDAHTPRDFLRLLDETPRELFCLLADQDSRIGSALDGTFLGKPAKLNPVPDFLLKHRPETPVFFCWIEERGRRKTLHAEEAERFRLNGRNDERCCNGRNDKRCCNSRIDDKQSSIVDGPYRKWLEERISENPNLWYGWTHRRFRSADPEIYR